MIPDHRKEKIEASTILTQVKNGDTPFYYNWPWSESRAAELGKEFNPSHMLAFRCKDAYESGENWGWYCMRVWITVDGKEGFLCDRKCPFILVKDIPMKEIWTELKEIYTYGKMGGDPRIVGVQDLSKITEYENEILKRPHPARQMAFDNRYPWQGYYRKVKDSNLCYNSHLLQVYEGTML